eukprot:NODE_42_length_34079_cov_0.552619.p15 type:complete len:165 gc:universal NODE_42_length_34079_cov_0.552619:23245-23739(+)
MMEEFGYDLKWSPTRFHRETKLRLTSGVLKKVKNAEGNYDSLKAELSLEFRAPRNDLKYTADFFSINQRLNQSILKYNQALIEKYEKCHFEVEYTSSAIDEDPTDLETMMKEFKEMKKSIEQITKYPSPGQMHPPPWVKSNSVNDFVKDFKYNIPGFDEKRDKI